MSVCLIELGFSSSAAHIVYNGAVKSRWQLYFSLYFEFVHLCIKKKSALVKTDAMSYRQYLSFQQVTAVAQEIQ